MRYSANSTSSGERVVAVVGSPWRKVAVGAPRSSRRLPTLLTWLLVGCPALPSVTFTSGSKAAHGACRIRHGR